MLPVVVSRPAYLSNGLHGFPAVQGCPKVTTQANDLGNKQCKMLVAAVEIDLMK